MPVSRLNKRKITTIERTDEIYKSSLESRDIMTAYVHETPAFSLDDTQKDLNFSFKEETWKDGDRLYKLSQKHYNSTEFWWVIGLFNQKPTDSDFEVGDLVLVPYPLEDALDFIGVY